jgi:hypothetical protein
MTFHGPNCDRLLTGRPWLKYRFALPSRSHRRLRCRGIAVRSNSYSRVAVVPRAGFSCGDRSATLWFDSDVPGGRIDASKGAATVNPAQKQKSGGVSLATLIHSSALSRVGSVISNWTHRRVFCCITVACNATRWPRQTSRTRSLVRSQALLFLTSWSGKKYLNGALRFRRPVPITPLISPTPDEAPNVT